MRPNVLLDVHGVPWVFPAVWFDPVPRGPHPSTDQEATEATRRRTETEIAASALPDVSGALDAGARREDSGGRAGAQNAARRRWARRRWPRGPFGAAWNERGSLGAPMFAIHLARRAAGFWSAAERGPR